MVFGVFDLLHEGHISFLKQAKNKGHFLIVSVARDANVKKIKGRKPVWSERKRAQALRSLPFVDKVVLGGLYNPLPHIRKEKPDIIALGYDQKPYVAKVQLKQIAKIVRLKGYKPGIYKSSYFRHD